MKTAGVITFLTLAVNAVFAATIQKRSSSSWAGANLYMLQGFTPDLQRSYLSSLASAGAKVVRVWVNAQPENTCEKQVYVSQGSPDLETTIGQYNNQTLDLLDAALANIQAAGLKAIITPHDANLLDGSNGNDIYGQTYGSGDFYTDPNAAQQYDARLNFIANYVSPSSGKAWKDWKEAIMAFDIQNEPMSVNNYCSGGDPSNWLCDRVEKFRAVIGDENPIKIGTGGIGGDYSHNCNFASFATNCPSVDLVSVHRYADNGWDTSGYISSANGKLVYVEEWGISYKTDDQSSEFPSNANTMNSQGLPWIYWEVLPPVSCSTQDSDTFAIYQDGDIDYASAMMGASSSTAAQDWSGII